MLTIQGHWYHPTFLKRHWKSLCFLEEISDNLLAQRPGFPRAERLVLGDPQPDHAHPRSHSLTSRYMQLQAASLQPLPFAFHLHCGDPTCRTLSWFISALVMNQVLHVY